MGITWVDYKGKRILYADYRESGSLNNLLQILDNVIGIARTTHNVLLISNFEGETAYPQFIERIKLWGKDQCQKNIVKSAVIGISGIKMVYYNTYVIITGDKKTKAFSSYNNALDWLVS
jgi:hypothetical protein